MPAVSQLKSGRWRVQWRDHAGRKVSAGRSFPTETMARKFGLDREADVRRGERRDPNAGRMLLRDWTEEWLQNRVAEPRTLSKIRSHLDRYVLAPVGSGAALGDMRLEQVDEMALQAWVKRLQTLDLAPTTIEGIYTTCASVIRAAVRADKVRHDPTQTITLPTAPPASDFYWEPEEINAIRAQLTSTFDRALFEILIGTGIRWGEAAGLHKDRWQPLRKRLAVVEVLEEDKGFRLKHYPKGKKRRDLPAVDQDLIEAMAAHLAETPAVPCGLDHGKGKKCSGLVFHEDGKPMSRHGWSRRVFGEAVQAAGVRRGTVHDLRHTYASWLVIDGVALRVVQELLGHASIRTTERYSHLSPETLDDPRLLASLQGRTRQRREAEREAEQCSQVAHDGSDGLHG